MICLYLLLALFSCDLAQSRSVPLWYKEIESLLANHLSNDEEMTVTTREGVKFTGTLSEIEHFLHYDSKDGQNIVFDDSYLEDSTENVFGTDERHLQNPDNYPFTAMGRLAMGCTGTFISPHVVLTAAHCVYNRTSRQQFSGLDFYRGKYCGPVYWTYHKWSNTFVPGSYSARGSRAQRQSYMYDIAWIIYSNPSAVYMPYTSDMPPVGTQISIYGYPQDKENECLWGSSGPLLRILQNNLIYQVDTYHGMSGSAVYYNDGEKDVIIGVHTGSVPDRRYIYHHIYLYNIAMRMTKSNKQISGQIVKMHD